MTIPMFRAWDKQYKKMGEVTMLLFLTDELDHSENNNEPKKFEHFELMQMLPLSDRNMTSLYVGDIVKDTLTKQVYEIKYGFCKKYAFTGFYCETKEGHQAAINGDDDNPQSNSQIELLGNIFEHPNLLIK